MHEEQNSALNSKDRVYVVKLKVNNNDTFYSVFVGAENCLITKVSLDQIH